MHKNYLGNHYADLLKTWIDWDQDGQYEESESLFFSELVGSPLGVDDTNTYVNESFDFYSTGFTLTSSNIGEIDILTRVTCSESLLLAAGLGTSWNDQWNFSMSQYNSYFNSDGRLVQGELQYNTLVVNPSSDPIPEPTTMLLFGAGLVAFAGFAQRKRNLNKKG